MQDGRQYQRRRRPPPRRLMRVISHYSFICMQEFVCSPAYRSNTELNYG
jgi:hypothetical protein